MQVKEKDNKPCMLWCLYVVFRHFLNTLNTFLFYVFKLFILIEYIPNTGDHKYRRLLNEKIKLGTTLHLLICESNLNLMLWRNSFFCIFILEEYHE